MTSWVAGLALSICLLLLASAPAQADKVGVAAAVEPDAFSSLSGTPNKQLNIGKSIFYNERINTTASGLVQVLLVDGSTFTVGPNSNLVIDKFVYDPNKKTGALVATFSRGTMRFIGGKLSKNEGGVKVNTPSGALAIRGGMFQGSTSRGIYSFLYGHSLTFTGRNGQSQTIFQPGYTLDLHGGHANVRPTTPEDTNIFMQALSNNATRFGSGGNVGPPTNPGTFQEASNLENNADQQINNANFIMVQTSIADQLSRLKKLQDNPTEPTGPTGPTGPEPPVKEGGTFTGYSSGFLQTGENGTGEPELLYGGTSRVVLDPEGNTVTANISTDHIQVSGGHQNFRIPAPFSWVLGPTASVAYDKTTDTSYNLGFTGAGDAAYVDDDTFLALGDDGSTSIVRNVSQYGQLKLHTLFGPVTFTYDPPDQNSNFNNVSHTGAFASIPNAPLCEKCDFLKYGLWASDVSYGDNQTDKMGGWWVATNERPVTPDDLPERGNAFYEGTAVGTFAKAEEGGWTQGPATGDMTMDWTFEKRKGHLEIADFGNPDLGYKTFRGKMYAPGYVDFSGNIYGGGGKGFAAGSFVGPRPGTAPAGVMGNFGIAGSDWKANGIFGAGNTRFTPGSPHIN